MAWSTEFALPWLLNVFSSVSIVMVNKVVMSRLKFHYGTSLTALHFLTTALISGISSATFASASLPKPVSWSDKLVFSVIANVSIVGMNLSLWLNSVGFYQLAKLAVLPCVCLLEWLLHGRHHTVQQLLAVALVTAGVGVCTVTDVQLTQAGLIVAGVAIAATAFQQLLIAQLHGRYSISSLELLRQTTPVQAVSLMAFSPVIDPLLTKPPAPWEYPFTWQSVGFISLSCLLAVLCNLSQYMCIGKFSATSFQVLGNMKTVIVIVCGIFFFDTVLTAASALGIVATLGGMILYSTSKTKVLKKE